MDKLKKDVRVGSRFKLGRAGALTIILIGVTALFVAYFYLRVPSARLLVLGAASVVILAASFLCYRVLGKSDTVLFARRVFPVLLLVIASVFTVFSPAGAVPDEHYHFFRSYEYANVMTFQQEDVVRSEDLSLFQAQSGILDGSTDYAHWSRLEAGLLDGQVLSGEISLQDEQGIFGQALDPLDISANGPQLKVPSAMGIMLAKALGVDAILLFYLGRFANMLYAALLIIFAVRITPVGRNVFMTAALLPITLQQIGSYSYDAATIGLAFLLTALLLNAICGEGKIRVRTLVGIAIVGCLLAPCKVIYTAILLLVFFIPKERFTSNRACVLFKGGALLLAFAMIVAFRMSSVGSLAQSSGGGDSRGAEHGTFYSLNDVLAHPRNSFMVIMNSLFANGGFYLSSAVGGNPGTLQPNLALPAFAWLGILFALLLSGVRSKDDDKVLSGGCRIVSTCAALLACAGAILSMWLGWTFNTEPVIQGVQGRYFLPVIPLLLIGMRGKVLSADANMGFPVVAAMSSIDFLYLCYVLAAAMQM